MTSFSFAVMLKQNFKLSRVKKYPYSSRPLTLRRGTESAMENLIVVCLQLATIIKYANACMYPHSLTDVDCKAN